MKSLLLLLLLPICSYATTISTSYQQGNAYVPSQSTTNVTEYKNCEYANTMMLNYSRLDTGNDPNFERIKQQNNRQIIIACQEELIKKIRNSTRDSY